MRIQINQLNPKTLGFKFNKRIISESLREVNSETLSIYPELSVSGSPLMDAISYSDVFSSASEICESLLLEERDMIFGSPLIIEKRKYNSMIMVEKGELLGISTKENLSQFDKGFDKGSGIEVLLYKNHNIGFGFLEDLDSFVDKKINVDTLIISSNTLFYHDSQKELVNRLIPIVRKLKTKLVFCNRSGAEGGYIYSGGSFILNQKGELSGILPNFKYHSQSFDIDKLKPIVQNSPSRLKNLYEALSLSIRDYYHKNHIGKLVLGLSGGIDSALVLALGVNALGKENVVGILMPSEFSSEHSVQDALESAKNLGIEYHIIPIKDCFNICNKTLNTVFNSSSFTVAEENIQSRLRCLSLMWYSNKFGGAILNTTNKSELSVGYGTLYGDTSGALSLLADIYKTEVWELSKYINEEYIRANPNKDNIPIPWNSISKPPSAELRLEQIDTDTLPNYDILDNILKYYIDHRKTLEEIEEVFEEEGIEVEKAVIERIIKLVKINEWKRRQCPMAVRVTKNCFGIDINLPIS